MEKKEVFERFAGEGLIKTADLPTSGIDSERKTKLNRKGNELFNRGEVETARRIFQTTGYSDGLIRVGDTYMEGRKPVDAAKMYFLAGDRRRLDALVEKMAVVIQNLLKNDEVNK
jgi:hypothetical protein